MEIDSVDAYIPEVQLENASNVTSKKFCVFVRFNRLLDEVFKRSFRHINLCQEKNLQKLIIRQSN